MSADDNDIEAPTPTGPSGGTRKAEGAHRRAKGDRPRYHHGALREALLDAAEAELRERGIEGFTLRNVAKRAGVSHAAPAYHFKDTDALLTALAAIGFRRFLASQIASRDGVEATPKAMLAASGRAYVRFAEDHTALFQLMFSSARPDRSDADLGAAATAAYEDLKMLAEIAIGGSDKTPAGEALGILTVWGMAHGLANLMTFGQMLHIRSLPDADRFALVTAVFERIAKAET